LVSYEESAIFSELLADYMPMTELLVDPNQAVAER
jgi:hypothetical protein